MRTTNHTTTVTITDEHTGQQATTTLDNVAEVITGWYEDAPAEVTQAITDLQAEIDAAEDYGGQATYLGIRIEPAALIETAEAAALAGVAESTWRAYVARRQPKGNPAPLPVEHVGRTPRWDRAEVQAWVNTRPGRGARTDLAQQ